MTVSQLRHVFSDSAEIIHTENALLSLFPGNPTVGARYAKLLKVPGQPVYSVFTYGFIESKGTSSQSRHPGHRGWLHLLL